MWLQQNLPRRSLIDSWVEPTNCTDRREIFDQCPLRQRQTHWRRMPARPAHCRGQTGSLRGPLHGVRTSPPAPAPSSVISRQFAVPAATSIYYDSSLTSSQSARQASPIFRSTMRPTPRSRPWRRAMSSPTDYGVALKARSRERLDNFHRASGLVPTAAKYYCYNNAVTFSATAAASSAGWSRTARPATPTPALRFPRSCRFPRPGRWPASCLRVSFPFIRIKDHGNTRSKCPRVEEALRSQHDARGGMVETSRRHEAAHSALPRSLSAQHGIAHRRGNANDLRGKTYKSSTAPRSRFPCGSLTSRHAGHGNEWPQLGHAFRADLRRHP